MKAKKTPAPRRAGTAATKKKSETRTRETAELLRSIEFLRRRDPGRYAQAIQLVAQAWVESQRPSN